MSRQLIPAAEISGPDLVTQSPPDVLHEAQQLTTAREHADAVARRYRFDDGFVEERLDAEVNEGLRISATGAMMVGRALMVWIDGAGKSIDWLVQRYQIPRATAYQHVRIFRAMRDRPALQELALRTTQTTILELLSVSPDDLDKVLAGDVSGLTPDELESLPRKELKARLLKLKSEVDTHGEIVAAKDQKINDLDRQLRTWKKSAAREKAEMILRDARIEEMAIKSACGLLEKIVHKALAEYGDSQTPLDDETRENINELVLMANAHTARLNILVQR